MDARSSESLDSRASQRLGQVVGGKYELEDLLGSGGMSSVYAASHRNGLAVAIKVLHDELASDEGVRRWFLREAYLANRVNHRGAVRVLDDDVTEDGAAYLVIERLYGDTLRAIWERAGRKMSAKEVALFAYDVLDVLAAAHARGIIHRDVKPENLFVTDEGEVKVLDFGIAHPLPVMGEAAATTTLRVAGTPAYMAPEQTRGVARAETDVWGVGATMFTLITGEYVHSEAPPPDLLAWAASRPARSVGTLARDLPSELAAVIDRALAFEPEQRFPTASAMRGALAEAFASAFGGSVGDARSGVLGELRAREPAGGRTARRGDVHSVATRVPAPQKGVTEAGAVATAPVIDHASDASRARREPIARWGAALGAAGLVIVLSAVITRSARQGRASSSQPSDAAAQTSGALGGLFAESTPPSVPSASASFRAAAQLWTDGSSWDAVTQFARAAKASPDFAAAHLWCAAAANFVDADFRRQYADAVLFRTSLNGRQLELLDALAPSMGDPEDLASTVARLSTLLVRHPDDADLRLLLASRLARLEDIEGGTRVLTPMLQAAHTTPLAHLLNARLLLSDERVDEARTALQSCIDSSPTATDCLYSLAAIDTNDGHCEALDSLCRSIIARNSQSPEAYNCLGNAVFDKTRSSESLQAAYQGKYELLAQSASLPSIRAQDTVDGAVATGHLEEAERLAEIWQRLASDPISKMAAYSYRTVLSLELGHAAQAKKIAREFLAVARSWPRSDFVDVEAVGLYLRSISGDLDAQSRAPFRTRVAEGTRDPSYGPAWRGWYNAYVLTSWSPAEATDALDHMPRRAFMSPEYRSSENDYLYGHVFALAGEVTDAKRFLLRASRSCAVEDSLYRVRATLELARLSEGEPREACRTYADVARAWPADAGSQSVAAALAKRKQLHCSNN